MAPQPNVAIVFRGEPPLDVTPTALSSSVQDYPETANGGAVGVAYSCMYKGFENEDVFAVPFSNYTVSLELDINAITTLPPRVLANTVRLRRLTLL